VSGRFRLVGSEAGDGVSCGSVYRVVEDTGRAVTRHNSTLPDNHINRRPVSPLAQRSIDEAVEKVRKVETGAEGLPSPQESHARAEASFEVMSFFNKCWDHAIEKLNGVSSRHTRATPLPTVAPPSNAVTHCLYSHPPDVSPLLIQKNIK
jgi:hypothetical protein